MWNLLRGQGTPAPSVQNQAGRLYRSAFSVRSWRPYDITLNILSSGFSLKLFSPRWKPSICPAKRKKRGGCGGKQKHQIGKENEKRLRDDGKWMVKIILHLRGSFIFLGWRLQLLACAYAITQGTTIWLFSGTKASMVLWFVIYTFYDSFLFLWNEWQYLAHLQDVCHFVSNNCQMQTVVFSVLPWVLLHQEHEGFCKMQY